MSTDNRSVFTDALETLGTFLKSDEKRDAIHLAVEPVIAGEPMMPGAHIGVRDGKAYVTTDNPIGIVDPFLPKNWIKEGQHFWLVIYPRKITSLRHVWTHPDLPDTQEVKEQYEINKETSEEWIRNFSDHLGTDYDTLMSAAIHNEDEEELWFGSVVNGSIPPEFWVHVEIVTGRKIPMHRRPTYIKCSC